MSLDSRNRHTSRRLQIILLAMIGWDILAVIAAVSFGGPFFKIDGDQMGGLLATKASLGGAAFVPIAIYLYAFVRGPLRHKGVLWAGVVEQGATALASVFHLAAGNVAAGSIIVPLVMSSILLVLLLLNMPRSQPVAGSQ